MARTGSGIDAVELGPPPSDGFANKVSLIATLERAAIDRVVEARSERRVCRLQPSTGGNSNARELHRRALSSARGVLLQDRVSLFVNK